MKNVYTIQELQHTKLYELPNVLYNAILNDLQNVFHKLTSRLLDMVKWEDSKPWLIEDLKKLEVVDEYEK